MEQGSIEREIHIDATPEVVYDVISTPAHMREWWPDEVDLDPTPGATGTITFGTDVVQPIAVVEADRPRRFSFRWVHDEGEPLTSTRSLLVTFDLVPAGTGTLLRFSETGFREKGWAAALREQEHAAHVAGWDHFLPRLVALAARIGAAP